MRVVLFYFNSLGEKLCRFLARDGRRLHALYLASLVIKNTRICCAWKLLHVFITPSRSTRKNGKISFLYEWDCLASLIYTRNFKYTQRTKYISTVPLRLFRTWFRIDRLKNKLDNLTSHLIYCFIDVYYWPMFHNYALGLTYWNNC